MNNGINIGLLYAALDEKRKGAGLSWRGLATKLGMSPSTLTRMGNGGKPDADSLALLLRWLGEPITRFEATPASGETKDTLTAISLILHSDPRLSPEHASAIQDVIRIVYGALANNPSPHA